MNYIKKTESKFSVFFFVYSQILRISTIDTNVCILRNFNIFALKRGNNRIFLSKNNPFLTNINLLSFKLNFFCDLYYF
ncbi:hypothetical protein EGI22_05835 [Lacihabitans sp. LS3-19]|nr:hypothetical protein [Lacihabitans sp. LS3-19]